MLVRAEGLKKAFEMIGDAPCIITVGMTWVHTHRLRPSDGNFQVKTLGSGSSVGLGLALTIPEQKFVVLDGDGAVIMNVNGLVTVGRVRPKNLVHIVFDNKVYEASGAIPTATSFNADLVALAKSLGIEKARRVATVDQFAAEVKTAMTTDGPHFIVVDTAAGDEDHVTSYARHDDIDNKFRFVRYLEALTKRKLREDSIDVKLSIK